MVLGVRELIPHSKPTLGKDDAEAVKKTVLSGHAGMGQKTKEFENALARYVGVKEAAAVSSGTAALHLALLSLGVGRGDEVIMPSFVCPALLDAALYVGAKPVVVDVNEYDCNISAKEARAKTSARTKAIIVPHLFGLPAELDELLELGIPVIEDCAHSLGARYKGKRVGSFGEASIYSFYATKMICAGEGGMVASDNLELIERVRDLRDYTGGKSFALRFNYKMSDLNASLGLSQLKKLDSFVRERKRIAALYQKGFSNFPLVLPREFLDREHVFYRYVVRTKYPEAFRKRMLEKGVACGYGVREPLHNFLSLKPSHFPASEKLASSVVSIPIYPSLSKQEAREIIEAVEETCSDLS